MPEEPIPQLRPYIVSGNKEVSKILVDARRRIEKAIDAALVSENIVRLDRQQALYGAIQGIYDNLDGTLTDWARRHTGDVVEEFNALALQDLPNGDSLVMFDEAYTQEVFERIGPGNRDHIAAVRTRKMAQGDIDQLRSLAIEKTRLASVAGQTQKQAFRELKNAWEGAYKKGTLNSWQFIDRRGVAWDNSNYFSMLVRTLSGKVSRDVYMDTLTANGYDLARINNSGSTSCPACTNFNGVIVSVSGTNPDYPSEADARSSGWAHPNCLCYLSYIDADRDEGEIESQAGLPNPNPEEPSKEAWLQYAKDYQQSTRAKTDKAPAKMRSPSKKQKAKAAKNAKERGKND